MMRVLNIAGYASLLVAGTTAFTTPSSSSQLSVTSLNLFDKFQGWGSASKDDLDEQWEAQQEILRNRRKPQEQRDKYFEEVKKRRLEASKKQDEMWSWQTKSYKKGEDPIDEWKKRRASGQISDLDDQYGKPEEKGGIPLPMASFGVGGEFGVGGKYDNGGRFDLRLPYADQGYVDEDSDVMSKFTSLFGGKKAKQEEVKPVEETPPKKKSWPW